MAIEVEDAKRKMLEQINMLAKWNEEHIKSEPEQCRKNLDTMVECLQKVGLIR